MEVRIIDIADFLTSMTDFKICKTKSEVRRLIKQGGLSFNKEKLPPDTKWLLYIKNEDGTEQLHRIYPKG